jgi:hypothetical protein
MAEDNHRLVIVRLFAAEMSLHERKDAIHDA